MNKLLTVHKHKNLRILAYLQMSILIRFIKYVKKTLLTLRHVIILKLRMIMILGKLDVLYKVFKILSLPFSLF